MLPLIPRRRRACAFSLIELLVVIGIIAVLIGILLPVVSSARKQAQTVACASNLRQLGVIFSQYAAAQQNRLPPLNTKYPGVAGQWYYDYLKQTGALPAEDDQPDAKQFSAGVARCGSVTDEQLADGWGGGYGVNEHSVIKYAPTGGSVKISQVRRASQVWLIGDVGRPYPGSKAYYPWVATFAPPFDRTTGGENSQQPALRHKNETANVCFVDGHVEGRTFSQVNGNEGGMFGPVY
jgi:prepilin-type processing-associated H-X9-DG protein/prepilin-type N-terminal cleavage/methylation domain-containing protein